jgi:hypothetical protein
MVKTSTRSKEEFGRVMNNFKLRVVGLAVFKYNEIKANEL